MQDLILSRLNYYILLHTDPPDDQLGKLQYIQNMAYRIIFKLQKGITYQDSWQSYTGLK